MSGTERNNEDPKLDPEGRFPISRSEQTLVVGANGSVSKVEKPAQDYDSRLGEIIDKWGENNCSTAEASRAVVGQLVLLADEALCSDLDRVEGAKVALKALRAAEEIVMSRGDEQDRRDVLNVDGPKCQFFLDQMTNMFEKALRAATRGDEETVQKIMNLIKDGRPEFINRLRREIKEIGNEEG